MSWTFCRRHGESRQMVTEQPAGDVALEAIEPPTVDLEGTRQQRLSRVDLDLVRTKRRDANRLGFAVLLLHFRTHCRFPRSHAELEPGLVADVMAQLGIATASSGAIELTDRTESATARKSAPCWASGKRPCQTARS